MMSVGMALGNLLCFIYLVALNRILHDDDASNDPLNCHLKRLEIPGFIQFIYNKKCFSRLFLFNATRHH